MKNTKISADQEINLALPSVTQVFISFCFNSGEESSQQLPIDTQPTPTFTSASSPTSPSSLLLPPSYSLALGLDLHEEEAGEHRRRRRRRMLVQTPGQRSDFLSDSASTSCVLASHTQELTASELLRNR